MTSPLPRPGKITAPFLRRLGFAVGVGLLCAQPLSAETVTLTLEQTRAYARQAVLRGNTQLAEDLARAILQRAPQDPQSYMVLAAVALQRGQMEDGIAHARRAFHLGQTQAARYEAARLVALTSAQMANDIQAQFWFRRAVLNAPTPQDKQRSLRDLQTVRARNPIKFSFDASITPVGNLNGGATGETFEIDGKPINGQISPDGQALSGIAAVVDVGVRLRLRQSDTAKTSLRLRGFARNAYLSDAAKAKAPEARGSDFNYRLIEVGLWHETRIAPAKGTFRIGLDRGQTWFGGQRNDQYWRLTTGYGWSPAAHRQTDLVFTQERRRKSTPEVDHARRAQVSFARQRVGGDLVLWGLALHDLRSPSAKRRARGADLYFRYTWAKPITPMDLSATTTLGASATLYPDYNVGAIIVPGGRRDYALFARLDLTLNDLSYAGFSPTVGLYLDQTWSNVSRFDTRSLGVSFGLRSQF